MAKKKRIKDEDRARIVLSRERDIERKLDEKDRINQQLEMYMKQYAELTGDKRIADDSYRGKDRAKSSRRMTLIAIAAIVIVVGALVAYKLIVS